MQLVHQVMLNKNMRLLAFLIVLTCVNANADNGYLTTTNGTTIGGASGGGGSGTQVYSNQTITVAVGSASLTTSAGAQDLTANRTVTLDTAQNIQTSATPQFGRLGLGVAADGTALIYGVQANNAATASLGFGMTNSTVATSANPKASPRIEFWGNGFGTTGSTNAPVGFSISVIPTSAATAGGSLVISNMLGAAGPTRLLRIDQTGNMTFDNSPTPTITMNATTINQNGISSGGGFTASANSLIGWSSGALISGSGNNVQLQNGNQTLTATLQWAVTNVTKTANYTVVGTDGAKYFNNIGASAAVTNTLPTAVSGMQFSFYVDAAQILCIQATGSDTIRYRSTVSAAAGNIFANATGSYIHIFSPAALKWVVDHISASADWTGPQ